MSDAPASPNDQSQDATNRRDFVANGKNTGDLERVQLLKSSTVVGGAQFITLFSGIVRVKLIALLVGPSGVGLLGVYQAIMGVASQISGLGLSSSGIRCVADASGRNDPVYVRDMTTILQSLSWVFGLIGSVVFFLLAEPISRFAFGDTDHVSAIRWLSVTVLFTSVTGAQLATMYGFRCTGDVARISVVSSVVSALVVAFIIALFRAKGIIGACIAIVVIHAMTTYFYYYRNRFDTRYYPFPWEKLRAYAGRLLSTGFTVLWIGGLGAVFAFLIQSLIHENRGIESVGNYNAAYSLSFLMINFITASMYAEFLPQVAANASNHDRVNRLINQQTEISLLLAFPGALGLVLFAPWLIAMTHSFQFVDAASILKWFAASNLLRVFSNPLSMAFMALGKNRMYAIIESIFTVVNLLTMCLALRWYGLPGVAIGTLILLIPYTLTNYWFMRHVSGFAWDYRVGRLSLWMLPLVAIYLAMVVLLPQIYSLAIGTVILGTSAWICAHRLVSMLSPDHRIAVVLRKLGVYRFAGV